MSPVARAIAAAAKTAKRTSGVAIVYRRGDDEIPLTAVPGTTNYLQTDAAGQTQVICQARDYLIIAEELLLADVALEPQEGDEIDEIFPDGAHTYQVLPLPQEPCWRWNDKYQIRRRVHTKETDHP